MNSSQAKKIQIVDYLQINAEKEEVWIKSPFNPGEKTASFKINTVKNVWYDFARGEGGNILDLVMALNNCNLSQALEKLETGNFSFSQAKLSSSNTTVTNDKNISQYKINKVQSLQNKALIDYLKSRKINIDIANKYLQEVYYKQKDKNYFALAFENDSKGFEVRNAYFKGCLGSKDIATIKGIGNKELSIFEGFMDFLSALMHFKIDSFKSDVIVLNSVAQKSKIEELLYSDLYNKIYLFLDNDKKGKEVKNEFYNINNNCIDCSNFYKGYKDFNEFLNRV
jgi:DNA primase